MINPSFLNTFLSLAGTKSFTKTAEALHMTQPGVSQHLKWLEEYFKQPLIEREGKKFELTEAGHRVIEYARSTFLEHDRFKQSLATDDPHAGICRFASPGSFGLRMYDFLMDLNRRYPKLIISFSFAPNSTIVKDILDDRLDIGFITRDPDESSLETKKIAEETLQLMVPAKFNNFSYAGLQTLGFINHPDGFHHASRLLQQNFPKEFHGMDDFKIRGFMNQITRILDPVSQGLGFTALPDFACDASTCKPKPKVFPLKKSVVDPILQISKKHRKLPSRFEFIMNEFKSFKI